MFQRTIFSFLTLAASAIAAVYYFHIRVQPGDGPTYKKMVQENMQLRSRDALERQPLHQFRKTVQKDIWDMDGSERLHFQLKSSESELILTQKKGKAEAIEKLKQITCWIQDEIDPKLCMSQLRRISAEEGIYYFPSHRFLAETVDLAFFRYPGIELPLSLLGQKPFLVGTAKQLSFSAAEKLPIFTAFHLKAKLDLQKGFP
ncbi:MAG: hypothetical protein V4487_03015 [Chlamydiota bacterium]